MFAGVRWFRLQSECEDFARDKITENSSSGSLILSDI